MNEATLSSLLEYLYGALTPSNQRWLAEHLIEHAESEDLMPYTLEELHTMMAEGEREFAEGKWQDSEEMFRELEEEFANEELQYAEAV
jgi:hypothetical protein